MRDAASAPGRPIGAGRRVSPVDLLLVDVGLDLRARVALALAEALRWPCSSTLVGPVEGRRCQAAGSSTGSAGAGSTLWLSANRLAGS
jgi:hypothetical protein